MAEIFARPPRKAALKTGRIFFGEKQECRDCLVWDLDKTGAMIEVEPGTIIPTVLRLISEGLYLDQSCEVVWRDGRKLELTFRG